MDERGEPSDAFLAAMFRALAADAVDYFSCLDRDRRVLFLSRTLSRDPGEVLGQRTERFVAEADRELHIASTEAAFVTGVTQLRELGVTLADGSVHYFEIRTVPFRGPLEQPLVLQITTDVTERRRLSEELSRSEEFRHLIFENWPDYVVLADRDRRMRWVNRVAPGLIYEKVIGTRIDDFIAEPDRAKVRAAVESAFQTGKPAHYEVEGYGYEAEQSWHSTRVVPVLSPQGVDNVLLITTDVTVMKRAELALLASEARFRALAERSPDLITILDRSRVIEYVNRSPHNLTDSVGKCLDEFAKPEDLEPMRAAIESVFATGEGAEFEAGGRDDSRIYRVRVAPFEWVKGRQHALAVWTDVTLQRADEEARQSLQAQLHQAQRRESVGMLAGGIAHDFNNLLQVIQTNLHFASEALEQTGLARDELTEAMRATERAAELTKHLLAIGRRQRVNKKSVDLSDLIAESLRMLRRMIPENIQVSFTGSALPCIVSVDPPQLEQVLLNLCLNARDAMPEGGQLSVSVRITEGNPRLARLRVTDSGAGIAEGDLRQVFEPFFTTKGAGSGLGLAVAAGIVAAHGGIITVMSRVGAGSTFTVDLPLAEGVQEEKDAREMRDHRGSELLLVVEDEPLVRAQAVRILRSAGYTVLEAEGGERALALFAQQPDAIKLVLLDVIMPGLDGWQVYSRLEALRADVKVMFITGYAASALPQDFGSRGKPLLSKPYQAQALLELVREILDGD